MDRNLVGAELVSGLSCRDHLCWQTAKKQTDTNPQTFLPHSKVTGRKCELLPQGLREKGQGVSRLGGRNRQDPASINLAWQLKTHTVEALRTATPCEHEVSRKGDQESRNNPLEA